MEALTLMPGNFLNICISTPMALSFELTSDSKIPLYKQIADQLKKAIKQGKCNRDSPLPSLTTLSRNLSISKSTPLRAYSLLAKEGLIKWDKGRGFFVTN